MGRRSRSRSRSPRRRDRERRRSTSRDRDRDRRERHRSPPTHRRRRTPSPRRRSPPRRRSRDRGGYDRRDRRGDHDDDDDIMIIEDPENGPSPRRASSRDLNNKSHINDADLAGKSEEEIEMMKVMGFGNFDTSKGKHICGNDIYVADIQRKRRYRQYMNRRGGFNRPLDFIA